MKQTGAVKLFNRYWPSMEEQRVLGRDRDFRKAMKQSGLIVEDIAPIYKILPKQFERHTHARYFYEQLFIEHYLVMAPAIAQKMIDEHLK